MEKKEERKNKNMKQAADKDQQDLLDTKYQ